MIWLAILFTSAEPLLLTKRIEVLPQMKTLRLIFSQCDAWDFQLRKKKDEERQTETHGAPFSSPVPLIAAKASPLENARRPSLVARPGGARL